LIKNLLVPDKFARVVVPHSLNFRGKGITPKFVLLFLHPLLEFFDARLALDATHSHFFQPLRAQLITN
jgi:hypothetical protein